MKADIAPPRQSLASHFLATLGLGLPLIGAAVAQMALHVVNTAMVGWYGVVPQSGLVIAASCYFVLLVLGTGFGRAVMPLAAAAKARGDEAELRRAARMGLWLSLGYGALTYPLFWLAEPLLLALGQQPEVAHEAEAYLRLAGPGLGPGLSVLVLQGWLAALGRTQVALWLTVAAVFINAALNWFLIFGNGGAPELGVAGAGAATLFVQLFSLISLGAYAAFLPSLRRYQLFRRFWRADLPALREVWRLGLPIGLTGLAETGLFQSSAVMMGWIGAAELAAHGIALEITALGFMLHVGLSNAATIRVAGFAGTGNAFELRRAAIVALALSVAVALVMIGIFLSWPEVLVRLFLDLNKPDADFVLQFGALLLFYAGVFQLADAMQVMALGLLRGIQDTRVPMLLAAISYWLIGVPACYTLAFILGYGGAGLWIGLVIALAVAASSLMLRFWMLAPQPRMAGEAAL